MQDLFTKADKFFMAEAINEAKLAKSIDEVPIGAVGVCGDRIVGRGHNFTYKGKSALNHAEIYALKEAGKNIGDFRLEECTMYVSLEPCLMCAGAIMHSRIKRLVVACEDPKRGGFSTSFIDKDSPHLNVPEISYGLMKEESLKELQSFFRALRAKKSQDKPKLD